MPNGHAIDRGTDDLKMGPFEPSRLVSRRTLPQINAPR